MMKKVLSVALSVIMVLSLLSVPGFAADPAAAVEYTVSNVSYAVQVADGDGYVLAGGIQVVPDNGKKLVPSVSVSASEASTATVIFAVYTDDVLTNAFYETKAVGTDAVTFSKEITVADKDKETYAVYVLGADGKAIAPASVFPAVNANLAYVEITYADGEVETYYGAHEEDKKIDVTLVAGQEYIAPTIKVVPECNTSVVDIDMADIFAIDGATFTITPLVGDAVTYTIKPTANSVKPAYVGYEAKLAITGNGSNTKTAANNYPGTSSMFGGGLYKVAGQKGKILLDPTSDAPVDVKVPYGAEKLLINDSTEVEILTTNGVATTDVMVDGKTYTLNISWKDYDYEDMPADAPLVYDLKYYYADKTALVKDATGAYIAYYYAMPTRLTLNADVEAEFPTYDLMKKDGSGVLKAAGEWITLASHDKANLVTFNNGASLNRSHVFPWSFESFVTAGEIPNKYALDGATMIVAHYADTNKTTPRYEFKTAQAGVVYVLSSVENTALTTADGWSRVEGAQMPTMSKYSGTLTATEEYANAGTNYKFVYKKTVTAGTPVVVYESAKSSGEGPVVIVATNAMLGAATPDTPDTPNPDQPTPDEPTPDTPVEPEVPTTAKLASLTYATAAHLRYTEAATETATEAWGEDATEYVVEVPIGTGTVTVSAAADYAATPNALAAEVVVDMAGKDEATAEILGNTVTFKWDDTDPYISDVKFAIGYNNKEAYNGRWGVDNGADGDLTHLATGTNDSGNLSSTSINSIVKTENGETAFVIDKYAYSIATHSLNGQSHMATTNFILRDGTYEGTNADNSLLSFKVSAPATVYVKAVTVDNQWEELVAAGWTESGTFGGFKLYKKEFAAGSYVYLPGSPVDAEEAAAAATATKRYIAYNPTEVVETTTGTKTLAEAFEGITKTKEGMYFEWSYDAEAGKLIAPATKQNSTDALTVSRGDSKYNPVFFIQFAEPAAPVVPTLASYSVSTTNIAMQRDVATLTDEAGVFTGENYTIVVPVGTATATATITDSTGATGTVTVEFGDRDAVSGEVTVGESSYMVDFVWDENKPYFYNVKISDTTFGTGRINVQYGDLAETLVDGGANGNVPAGNVILGESSSYTFVGIPAPTATEDTVVIGVAAGAHGQEHMKKSQFNMIKNAYPATSVDNAFISFKVNGEGTIYVKSPASAGTWPEMNALIAAGSGWYRATYVDGDTTKNATIKNYPVYAIDVQDGDTVLIPGVQHTDEYMALYNASLASRDQAFRFVKYTSADEAITTTTGTTTWADAWAAANITNTDRFEAGAWYEWAWDAEANLPISPLRYNNSTPAGRMSKNNQILIYGYFGTVEEPEDPTPDQPTPDEPTPDQPATSVLSWTSSLALAGAPKAQETGANTGLYANGLYGLGEQSGEITLNPTETTVNLTVPYGVEVIQLNGGAKIDLLSDADHAVTTTVTVDEVEYTVNIAWDAYAYAAGKPMLYDLQYHVAGKDNLAGGLKNGDGWYYAVPSNLVLNADVDLVFGEGDLKGTNGTDLETVTQEFLEGEWFTVNSQKKGNYVVVNEGANINRLRISPSSFRTFVNAGIIENNYALNGATIVVAHYKDAVANTVVSPRYTFKSAVDGYVIAGYYQPQDLGDDWTLLENVQVETTNSSPSTTVTAMKNPPTGHSNEAIASDNYNFGYWFNAYRFVYVKAVSAGDVVTINETTTTNDQPPYVMVVTEDMVDIDLAEDPTPEVLKLASLSYTTALAVTEPTSSSAANTLHQGGIYQPTVVTEAAAVAVEADATTINVTVPYGSEIVNLAGLDTADGAVEFEAINLINNNGVATVTKTVGEFEYTINVAWAAAADATMGLTEGNLVYDVKYRVKDLYTAGNTYYNIYPSALVLNATRATARTENVYKTEAAALADDGETDLVYAAGAWYNSTDVMGANSNLLTFNKGGHVNRGRASVLSFEPWVRAGLVTESGIPGAALADDVTDEEVDAIAAEALNGTVVLVADYTDTKNTGYTGVNTEMEDRYSFRVAQDSIVYVNANSVPTGFTKTDAGKLYLHNQDNKKYSNESTDDDAYVAPTATKLNNAGVATFSAGSYTSYKFVKAGELVAISDAINVSSNMPPVIIVRPIDLSNVPAPTLASATYKVGEGDATAIDFAEGTTAAVEVPWGTDADISVTAKINGIGSVATSGAINLATAVDNTADVTVTVKAFDGEVVATYTVTFAWGEKPADPEEPGEGGDPVDPNPGEGEDPTPEEPTPVSLDDMEDMGIKADTDAGFSASQDAASTDITVSGSGAEHCEMIAVYVLADGKDMADLLAAIGTVGTGDLVEAGVILAMGQAWADEDGNFTVELTLPADATTQPYDVTVISDTGATEVEDAIDFVNIADKVAAYNAIIGAADATAMASAFADVGLIINTASIYATFTPADQALIQASVLADSAVDALPAIGAPVDGVYAGLENIAALAAIIDARVAAEVLNNGADAAAFDQVKAYLLPAADAESDDVAAVAGAIYAGAALNATGKANVLAAITNKNFEVTATATIKKQVQAAFAEAAFVELINNTNYTSVNSVKPLVDKYIEADVFEDMDEVTNTILADILKNKTITSYESFATLVNSYTDDDNTTSGSTTVIVPGTGSTGSGTTSGSMSNTTKPQEPVVDDKEEAKKSLSEFSDAADAAWAAPALQLMLDREILSGYEDGTIKPNNSATRQEVAKMLVEAFSEVNAGAWVGYDDVPSDAWYYSYVATATYEGIIKGVGDNKFGAGALITRQDLSVLIYRYLVNKGTVLNKNSANFTDAANISDYAAEAINALTNAGVIKGYEDGSFNPQASATRAEIAQVIANVITIFGL